jgi:nicotinate phosphoribosyltransferase
MTSITQTDAYKFSMAEAGFALREETFYYSHRKGGHNGWHYMPIDVEELIRSKIPTSTQQDYEFLSAHNYDVGAAVRKAYTKFHDIKINTIPQGSWFFNREPAFSITGASAAVSWFEPLVLSFQFMIQVATEALTCKDNSLNEKFKYATCQEEKDIIEGVFSILKLRCPKIEVEDAWYYDQVLQRAKKLVELVKDPNRIFEVGMRAVSCMQQHETALMALKEAGIMRTSNAFLAKKLNMIPVGTIGHEHIKRFNNDYEAFVSVRDRFPGFLFYLPDTYDTIKSGIPSALKAIAEAPERDAGIRFDSESGIREHYMFTIVKAREMGLCPRLALESGWNYDLTVEFEQLREMIKWPIERQAYGYGGYLVKPDWETFARDDVSAVYKLSQSGSNAVMKFGDEPDSGKQSLPGKPVIHRTHPLSFGNDIPVSFILQEGEQWKTPVESGKLSGLKFDHFQNLNDINFKSPLPPVLSPETLKLIKQCNKKRIKNLKST